MSERVLEHLVVVTGSQGGCDRSGPQHHWLPRWRFAWVAAEWSLSHSPWREHCEEHSGDCVRDT
jgi:hypothetical protein